MITKNKTPIIISSILILLPMVAGIILWESLPDQVAIHWNANGLPDGFAGKTFSVFALPLIILAIHLLGIFVTTLDNKNTSQSKKILNIMFWICPFISWISGITVYTHAMGKDLDIIFIVPAFLGFIFIIIGNYLPKCQINRTIGIKLPWTLKDEEVWNKTHRLSGILWVIGGILMVLTVFLPKVIMPVMFTVILVIMVAVPTVYSYVIYKRLRG